METFIKVVFIIVLASGLCLLAAYPTLWIVNYLFPSTTLLAVFGVPALTFWKAFWLNFLCAVFFKSTATAAK